MSEHKAQVCAVMTQGMQARVPHNRALGLEVIDYDPAGQVWMRLPWDPKLIGNPARGVIHGGAISTLMDAACGFSTMLALGGPSPIATLDLRIDYLRPATPGEAVIAHARCYRVTRHVCFVRGSAYVADPEEPVATVAATFARKARAGSGSSEAT
jgi:uncharacterized protein (TIGR00369 family)